MRRRKTSRPRHPRPKNSTLGGRPKTTAVATFVLLVVGYHALAEIVLFVPGSTLSVTSSNQSMDVDLDGDGTNDWTIQIDNGGGYDGGGTYDGGGYDGGGGGYDGGGGGYDGGGGGYDGGGGGYDSAPASIFGGGTFAVARNTDGTAKTFTPGDAVSGIETFDTASTNLQELSIFGTSTGYFGLRLPGVAAPSGPAAVPVPDRYGWVELQFNHQSGPVTSVEILRGAFESTGAAITVGAVAVPEPSSMAVVAAATGGWFWTRRRRR